MVEKLVIDCSTRVSERLPLTPAEVNEAADRKVKHEKDIKDREKDEVKQEAVITKLAELLQMPVDEVKRAFRISPRQEAKN